MHSRGADDQRRSSMASRHLLRAWSFAECAYCVTKQCAVYYDPCVSRLSVQTGTRMGLIHCDVKWSIHRSWCQRQPRAECVTDIDTQTVVNIVLHTHTHSRCFMLDPVCKTKREIKIKSSHRTYKKLHTKFHPPTHVSLRKNLGITTKSDRRRT